VVFVSVAIGMSIPMFVVRARAGAPLPVCVAGPLGSGSPFMHI
jgi:hypothetical protein